MAAYLTRCSVIDCVGDDLQPFPATVVLDDGRIVAIDRGDDTTGASAPFEAETVIDLEGAYLLPGLWDAHCHPGGMIPDPNRVAYFETEAEHTLRAMRNTMAALRAGVTALRSAGEASFIDVALREAYANQQPAGLSHRSQNGIEV